MKYRIMKFLQSINWIYWLSLSVVSSRIINDKPLTEEHLDKLGWILRDGYWTESDVKIRDTIWIQFENHYYRVYHGPDKTFIALKSTLGWFENYYRILSNVDHYELAGI